MLKCRQKFELLTSQVRRAGLSDYIEGQKSAPEGLS